MSDFPMYALSEADAEIAPYAADVDEQARYPQEAHDALSRADFFAPHIPEEYGGAGADALATCIVIEEVARVCGSSSLIPAVNKLGTTPLLVGASEEVKQRVPSRGRSGEAMFSYALSEREAGSDAASMKTRAVRDGDSYVLNGQKAGSRTPACRSTTPSWRPPIPTRARGGSRRSWCMPTTLDSRWAPRNASSASRVRPLARSSSRTSGSPLTA
jgi:hypothetical protein